jgi:hypothetical protein
MQIVAQYSAGDSLAGLMGGMATAISSPGRVALTEPFAKEPKPVSVWVNGQPVVIAEIARTAGDPAVSAPPAGDASFRRLP